MRPTSTLISAAWAGACLLAMPALAQDAAAPAADEPSALAPGAMGKGARTITEDDIVITGKAEAPPAEVRKQASAISRVTVKYREPLASFKDKVCPGIIGMPVEMAEIMVDRIRRNAEEVGLRTASLGKCAPNIYVIFVRNGQAVIKEMLKSQPWLLESLERSEQKALARDSGPVHSWTNTVVRSRQGDEMMGTKAGNATNVPILNVGQAQSHIFLSHRIDIANSVILIDIPAIDGLSVVQLADYVTMRAFARTNPVEGEQAVSTILSLFDPNENNARPYQLTDFDLAYLRAVYTGTDGLNAASKIAGINRELREIQLEAQNVSTPAK